MDYKKIAKFRGKINRLFDQKHKTEIFESGIMKLDKLIFVKEKYERSPEGWEWAIYYASLTNLVLSGEEAKEVANYLICRTEDSLHLSLEKYLNN